MGYTTDFEGRIGIFPRLSEGEIEYLNKFSDTRRMDRENGPYFIGGDGFVGQSDSPDEVYDHNRPPAGQPGLWCQWVPTDDGTALEWNQSEKFYESEKWMDYLIQHFLMPGRIAKQIPFDGHMLNGVIAAQGDDPSDMWLLHVKDNIVFTEDLVATPGGDVKKITKQAIAAPLKQITNRSK